MGLYNLIRSLTSVSRLRLLLIFQHRITRFEETTALAMMHCEGLENYLRRENIVFTGIPFSVDKDAIDVAVRATSVVGVTITTQDIVDAHRLPIRHM